MAPTLLLDRREPDGLRSRVETEFGKRGVQVTTLELPAGDYVFVYPTFTVGVERKAVSDLLNSIRSDRLRPQLANLLSTYTIPYLLIEGPLAQNRDGYLIANGQETGFTARAVWALLFSIQEQRIRIAMTPSELGTIERLVGLSEYYDKPSHSDLTNDRLGIFTSRSTPGVEVLMGVPGIGLSAAQQLLSHFGMVSSVVNATEQELLSCPGVGKKRAKDIWSTFHTPYVREQPTTKAG